MITYDKQNQIKVPARQNYLIYKNQADQCGFL